MMIEDSKSYISLDVWKKCRKLTSCIYSLTKKFPKDEQYGLTNQIRRSVVSIPSNIAEGCGRSHTKDSIHFFHISRGSLYELETQLYLSFDQNYITEEELDENLKLIIDCKKLINGFINYYKNLKR
ncbi:MAG: four helix bundle protein [Ignavibacteria bacterium]